MLSRFLRSLIWRYRLARLVPRYGTVTLDRQTPDYAHFLRAMRDDR